MTKKTKKSRVKIVKKISRDEIVAYLWKRLSTFRQYKKELGTKIPYEAAGQIMAVERELESAYKFAVNPKSRK